MKITNKFRNSIIIESVSILSKSDQKKIFTVILIQIISGLLDLAGIAIFGILGALAVTGIQSGNPGDRVTSALLLFRLNTFSFQTQIAFLGLVAVLILVGRTVFSILVSRRTLIFLSGRAARITAKMFAQLITLPIGRINKLSNQETLYAITQGVNTVVVGIIGITVSLISDFSLLLVLLVGLFIIDPLIAVSSLIFFSLTALTLYKIMSVRAKELGTSYTDMSIESSNIILETLNAYRETVVHNRRFFYVRQLESIRMKMAVTYAEMQFMPNISKYVIEVSVLLGTLVISAVQFLTQDAKHAVATLTVFLAAGTRIAPAIMRLQQGAIQIKSNFGSASPTLCLLSELKHVAEIEEAADTLNFEHTGFEPVIEVSNMNFRHDNSSFQNLSNISFNVDSGSSLALVGPSGAGKTSLVDVLLGINHLESGTIKISGVSPKDAYKIWPGAISYVPQDIAIISGSIRQNITLGYETNIFSDEDIYNVLEIAQLSQFVKALPNGLDTQVGEGGSRISGGQRQRLGIARALITHPKLLILDEATSALDSETEADVNDSISSLRGKVTVILIAHRITTILNSEKIGYLTEGRFLAYGTIEEVRKQIPSFEHQLRIIGIE